MTSLQNIATSSPCASALDVCAAACAVSTPSDSVILVSSDETRFEVSNKLAMMSDTINHMLEDIKACGGMSTVEIPLPNVSKDILAKVILFCTHYVDAVPSTAGDGDGKVKVKVAAAAAAVPTAESAKRANVKDFAKRTKIEMTPWDLEFCDVPQETLLKLIAAANYLHIDKLLNVVCQSFASLIEGKTPEQIRQQFHLKNDFTPEEQEQIAKQNPWMETQ